MRKYSRIISGLIISREIHILQQRSFCRAGYIHNMVIKTYELRQVIIVLGSLPESVRQFHDWVPPAFWNSHAYKSYWVLLGGPSCNTYTFKIVYRSDNLRICHRLSFVSRDNDFTWRRTNVLQIVSVDIYDYGLTDK